MNNVDSSTAAPVKQIINSRRPNYYDDSRWFCVGDIYSGPASKISHFASFHYTLLFIGYHVLLDFLEMGRWSITLVPVRETTLH